EKPRILENCGNFLFQFKLTPDKAKILGKTVSIFQYMCVEHKQTLCKQVGNACTLLKPESGRSCAWEYISTSDTPVNATDIFTASDVHGLGYDVKGEKNQGYWPPKCCTRNLSHSRKARVYVFEDTTKNGKAVAAGLAQQTWAKAFVIKFGKNSLN